MTSSDPTPGKVTMTITETKRIDVDAEDAKSFEAGGWRVASEPTRSDHDELLAEAERWPSSLGVIPSAPPGDLIDRLADALRAEQSARQAAEARAVSEGKRVEYTRSALIRLQQRIDAALVISDDSSLSSYERHNAMHVALTESKGPEHE